MGKSCDCPDCMARHDPGGYDCPACRPDGPVASLAQEDLQVTAHPPKPQGGMQTGTLPQGVRIVHLPTQCAVECEMFRTQYDNKRAALAALTQLVAARS